MSEILVVCPNQTECASIVAELEKCNLYNIRVTHSATSALAAIRERPPSLLICTLELDDLDGWRLARMVRCGALNCKDDTPILIFTEKWCQHITEITAREYGVNRVLPSSEIETLGHEAKKCLSGDWKIYVKPRLLVIEDGADTADLVSRVLDRQFQIDIAKDGETGIQLWRERSYSLVLLDYMLPNISGKEILKIIVADKPEQPVVMMTAHASTELAEQLMLLGASDFLAKPFRTEQLRKVCDLATRREDFRLSSHQFTEKVNSLEASEREYRRISMVHQQLLHNLQTVVMELDENLNLTFLNYSWQVLTGYDLDESLGQPLMKFLADECKAAKSEIEVKLHDVLSKRKSECEIELCLLDKTGHRIWAQMKIRRSAHQNQTTLTICLDNITKRKQAQEQLEYLAMHDSLTGLFNRHYFEESLKHTYADSVRTDRQHGLIYIDLDYFKVINDTFGHHEGDEVLRQISTLLNSRVRSSDLLSRLGGDEYALLVHDVSESGLKEIAVEFQGLVNDFTYQINGQRLKLGCSIGLSMVDGKASNAEDYLMQADIALYVAKGRGRNLIHRYNPNDSESEDLRTRVNWAQRVREAVADDRIILQYQPIFDVAKSSIAYHEALVRMIGEDGEMIYPSSFIPPMESTGEMHFLDRWIVKLAIRSLSEIENLEHIAINLSAQAFNDESLVPIIVEALNEWKVDPACITFELTESASLLNLNATKKIVENLHTIGCSFAIDDFGSGFSSFAYLKELPADYIKLDGSFIRHLHEDEVDKVLAKSLIQVVQAMGKKAVAEFVENEAIFNILQEFGVDYVQGYHIGRPVSAGEIKPRQPGYAKRL
jgi:PAS domain S-box/diguanylate cyclase (GGDEF) domain